MARLNSRVAYEGVQSAPVTKPTIVSLDERRSEAPRAAPAGSTGDDFDLDDVFEEPGRRGF